MKKSKIKITEMIGASLLTAVLCAGCDANVAEHERSFRHWKKNADGVSYNMTCVEGRKYVATPGSHDEVSLSGPIGDCGA